MHPKPTVALADDDTLLAEMVTAWLEHHGYDVRRFDSGVELVDWARSTTASVDAFLLDIDMPGLDGFESCRALRGIPIFAGTPALFVSSHDGDAVAVRVSEAGGSSLLQKNADLLPRLTDWLSSNLAAA
jgi:DNA-binding response OmpR family regulator